MLDGQRKTPHNSTYPKGGVLCSKVSFVINKFFFQTKLSANNPSFSKAADR
jgi:hypothetical protein